MRTIAPPAPAAREQLAVRGVRIGLVSAVGLATAFAATALPVALPEAWPDAAPTARAAYPSDAFGTCRPIARDLSTPRTAAVATWTPPERVGLVHRKPRHSLVTVRVYVHVLRTPQGGGVTNARAKRQVAVLNNAYAGRQSRQSAVSPFLFRLAGIDHTTNSSWYRMEEGTIAEGHAKRALHRGNADDLNLYIGNNRSGSLGWGTQPGSYGRAPKMDGVVIRRSTMAGGTGGRYSAGDAAVHETGHWLGLLHTFAGRCGTRGDLVADTPREGQPSYTCPVRRNTCSAPGRDPVHNFMDYSYDSCMNQFSRGQVSRMRQQWTANRAGGS